jgi:hypothetical protein
MLSSQASSRNSSRAPLSTFLYSKEPSQALFHTSAKLESKTKQKLYSIGCRQHAVCNS